MFVPTTVLYKYMKSPRNYAHRLIFSPINMYEIKYIRNFIITSFI